MMVIEGVCPVCNRATTFEAKGEWLRDDLCCRACNSIPRERALAWALETFCPDWRELVVHECSPSDRLVSRRMRQSPWVPFSRKRGGTYSATQYFPGVKPGTMHRGFRCENLEALIFADETIDLHCHLDVLEHVNEPAACFAEMCRTLRPGGRMIFTRPVYEGKVATERRAEYRPDGPIFFFEPEYHGNPVSDQGALVTFHYGADLSDLILEWAPGVSVLQLQPNDPQIGVLGKFRDVFVVTKKPNGNGSTP